MYNYDSMMGLAGCTSCGGSMGFLPEGINLTSATTEALSKAITALPEQDALTLLKQLPGDITKKICAQGVTQEVNSYMPYVLLGGAAIALFLILK